MHAARMVQVFDFSEPSITEHLRFDDGDWKVGRGVPAQTAEIIDLDGKVKTILHPGNASDSGKYSKCRRFMNVLTRMLLRSPGHDGFQYRVA